MRAWVVFGGVEVGFEVMVGGFVTKNWSRFGCCVGEGWARSVDVVGSGFEGLAAG